MEPQQIPKLVLDYHHAACSRSMWWWMLPMGGVPFVIEIFVVFFEATTGDPPNSALEFLAYHLAVVIALLLSLCWLICVGYKARGRYQWLVLLSAGIWCAWVCWVGIWFLRELNAHPAADYYWSQLKGK